MFGPCPVVHYIVSFIVLYSPHWGSRRADSLYFNILLDVIGILASVDTDEPVQPLFKQRNSK